MKKNSIFFFGFLLFLQFLFVGGAWGQSIANYSLSSGTASLDPMVGASSVGGAIVNGYNDDNASAVNNIGFNFVFMGVCYSQFSVNSNGQLRLGATVVQGSNHASAAATTAIICPMSGDNSSGISTPTVNPVTFKVSGSSGSRVLIVQWINFNIALSSTSTNGGTMQLWLYEGTGNIEFHYGSNYGCASLATRSIFISSSNTATTSGYVTVGASPLFTATATAVTNSISAGTTIANLSGVKYTFTPPSTPVVSAPTTLTFTPVTTTTTTVNWVDGSTNEASFVVTRATDANFTQNVTLSSVTSTTSAATGGAYSSAQTSLTPGVTYYYRVEAIRAEAIASSGLIGSQATTAGATYFWTGATGGTFSTTTNWNTLADGTGTAPTALASTDIYIVDGAGTSTGGALTINLGASASVGQLKVISNTTLTLASSATAQRVITITGGAGDDVTIENGSSLLLTNTTNPISIIFSGIGNTGDISGVLTVAGTSTTASSANSFLTTGGTGTIVTVSSTGVINNTATSNITTNGNVTGSAASLVFASGSAYNVSGATGTGAFWLPLATWATTSTITVSGVVASTTTPTNNNQSFGNFVYNCPSATGTMSVFTNTTTAVIKGDLTITAGATGGTGIFRTLTSGTLTVNGNVNVLQGRLQSASGAGTFIVLGNTTNSTNGILEINGGTYSQRGTTFTNDGILTGVAGSVRLQFFSTAAQTFAGSGTVLTNIGGLTVENGGLTITHTNQIPTLRVNLFAGTITGSDKLTMGTGAALNVTTQIGATGLTTPAGNFDAIPTFNLGTGAYNVIYQQESVARTTGFEIPSTRYISALTLSNSNGLTIAGGALSSAALTFSAGCGNITTSSSDVLTITGIATSAITRTSTTAYVNGPLELTLPSISVSGSTYLFPIGKTTLYPFELVNPITGGTVVVRAEVFDGNAGGTAGNIMATLSTSRYWAASTTSGSSNLTNTNIRLTDAATTGFDAIANSATVTGAYDIAGGNTSTVTSTTIQTLTPLTSLSGFYVMGSKAAATLATPSITPSGTQCTNVSRAISVLITPGGGAVTSVNLNYSINGTAQTAIAMTNTTNTGGADTWTATLPTVIPVNGAITWSITATDVNSLTRTINGTGYQDAPTTGITATATATPSSVCDGSNASLSVSLTPSFYFNEGFEGVTFPPSNWTLINGGTGNNWASGTSYVCSGSKSMQYSYNSSNAANTWMITPVQNLIAGNTYYISFNYKSYGSIGSPEKLKVTVGSSNTILAQTSTLLDLSSISNSTCNTASITYTPSVSGTYYFGFNCYTPSNYWSLGVDDITISTIQGSAPTPSAYSWSNGTTVVGTTNPLSTPIASGLTYTATATVNGCPMTAGVTPTVNPLPTAPTATPSSQCGAGIPTASVADNNSYSTPTFKWYSAATGGTLLQNSTSVTYTSSISVTTTFYVAVVGTNSCESARTEVTVNVSQPDAISAVTSAAAICLGQSVTLTAANTATTPTQTYSYSWACATTGSGATSANTNNPASITPSAAGSYTYIVTGTDGACSAVNTVAVTVNAVPTAISLSPATTTDLCMGDVKTIATSGGNSVSQGNITLGTGNSTLSTTASYAAFNGYRASSWIQTIYTASELSALGLGAGNITSIAYRINSQGSSISNNITIKIGTISATSFATTTLLSTSAFTTVYGPTSFTHTASGWQTINFATPYNWDGVSNIVVDVWQDGPDSSYDPATYFSTTSDNKVNYTFNVTPSVTPPTGFSTTSRFNVRFNGNINTPQPISWSPTTALFTNSTATTAYTGNPTTVYAKPTATTTYTATATNAAGCTTSASVAVTVATPSTQTLATNDYVWRGTTNTDWSTLTNWVKYDGTAYPVASTLPSSNDNVFIPQNNTCVVSQPSIGTGTVTVNTVYIEPSATVTGGSGTIDVKGDFTNNGTFTAGTGTVSFTGTAAQQVTGTTSFYNLTQNNSSGLTLDSPVTVSNNLTMTAGNITTTQTNILTLGNSAPASLTWTSGKVVGPMKRWMAATTNSGASSSMFPLGSPTRNAQASIEYTTAPITAGYLEAKFVASNPTSVVPYPSPLTDQFNYVLNNVVSEGYWEIKPSATSGVDGGAYTVTLEGETISLAASTNASYTDVRVIKSPVPHSSWVLQGAHGTATGANADFTVSRTGMSGYSYFAMAYPTSAPLPVELVSFAANCDDNNTVSVNWTTASEHNSDYYTVEKSRDGISWNVLKIIPAAGNSTQLINYSVADVADISGTVYYRLTQVDVDGASKMYDIVSTNCSSEKELALIAYPNPSNGQFTVKIENALGGKYDLTITDMQGKAIEEQSLDLETGTTVVKLNPVGLQPGVYLLQFMQDGNMLQQQKLIIE
jgi:hypothetical protein